MRYRTSILTILMFALHLGAQSQVLDLYRNEVLVGVNKSYRVINLNGNHLHLVNSQIDVWAINGIGKISGDEKSKFHIPNPTKPDTDIQIPISTSPVSTKERREIVPPNATYEWVANGNTLLIIKTTYQATKVVIKHEGRIIKVIESRPRNAIMISMADLPLNLTYEVHVLGGYNNTDKFTIIR